MTQIAVLSASFTRPNDTNIYALGDLVANSTTASAVIPLAFPGNVPFGYMARRCRIKKSGTGVTSAAFRVHVYSTGTITAANGDNGAWSTNSVARYLGAFDVTVDRAFTDGAFGIGAPITGSEMNGQGPIWALIEARGAYTPAANEVFTVELELVAS
jgi:hypothetical protein